MKTNMDIVEESKREKDWIYDLLFIVILLVGAYFRFTGLNWDEGTYLHPDERFLAMVETSLEPVGSFSEYWDTQTSSLNPNNRGHGFFVYGTLPIFFVRYIMEWFGQVGYSDVAVFGRPLAGIFDLLTIFMLYLVGSKLYDRRIGLLASAFSAFTVLQIQLSHFYTVDIFANVFVWLAVYLAARIIKQRSSFVLDFLESEAGPVEQVIVAVRRAFRHPLALTVLLFGIVTGAAAASKISAFPVAFLLPLAVWSYVSNYAAEERNSAALPVVVLMAFAGLLAFVSFRVFQPYAFSGPGFFGFLPNEAWLGVIGRLQELVEPSSGYPPSVQWFNRPIWFSWQNLTIWGLGLPLGLLAWAGFAWMGYRIYRGDWRTHIVVWLWVGLHFLWQSSVPNPTMRYQLPIYPGLGLIAAWGLVSLWDRFSENGVRAKRLFRVFVVVLGTFVLGATLLYAAAFTNIYRTDVTRIAASRWMYQSIPGAVNLLIQTDEGIKNQPLSFPNGYEIRPGEVFNTPFVPVEKGVLSELTIKHVAPAEQNPAEGAIFLSISQDPERLTQIASTLVNIDFNQAAGPIAFDFGEFIELEAFSTYFISMELVGSTGSIELCEPLELIFLSDSGPFEIAIDAPEQCKLTASSGYQVAFTPEENGVLPTVVISEPLDFKIDLPPQEISLFISSGLEGAPTVEAASTINGYADDVVFELSEDLVLDEGQTYLIQFVLDSGAPITFFGSVVAQETSWDDPLPMRVDGYDGFGGIYRGDNNMEMYWDDNAEKLDRITKVLDEVDVIPISSSRQWGSLTRLPERWPLVNGYYRLLLGCPDDRTVEWCYNSALPGRQDGRLGFELVKVFQSNPKFGFFEINDQSSEEAFTVYDHPKVFILVKTEDYDSAVVRSLLEDYMPGSQVSSGEDQSEPVKSLLLDDDRRDSQSSSGTWSAIFSTTSLLNRFQPLTVIVWYLTIFLVGIATYPVLRNLLPGLEDRGYPLARTAGLLVVSYAAWMLGSAGLEVSRALLTMVVFALVFVGGGIAWRQRSQLLKEWRLKKNYFLTIETFAALLFLFVLFIRIANPDLWHPWKGGEKPMDFAYFNAVLRSVSFPPYDPWFSGGYINYYYYGFVFVGVLVKWLGIVPAIAYNLIIPTLFMMVALGAFSISWNLVKTSLENVQLPSIKNIKLRPASEIEENETAEPRAQKISSTTLAYYSGLASAVGVTLLGNLGTMRMIIQGYQRIVAPPDVVLSEVFFLTRWRWTFEGLLRMMSSDVEFPYAMADWYWNPSRAIPAPGEIEPITEFPFFTFLYADLHAHMIAMPIALVALAWALSLVMSKGKWGHWVAGIAGFVFGGIVIGALRPTNTWDYPTYLVLGLAAGFVGGWQTYGDALAGWITQVPAWLSRAIAGVGAAAVIGGLSWFLYQPYTISYALGYTEVKIWQGGHTPLSAYLTHWGLYLLLIVSWMAWETRQWLDGVPAVAGLNFLKSKIEYIIGFAFIVLAIISALLYFEVSLALTVLPLAAWAGVLLLRPGQSDQKRIVLFLIGSGFFLSLMVETIVLSGDIGRMNTVFKFYLQVWILFGVSAAAILGWTLSEISLWNYAWRRIWQAALTVLVFAASLYPLLGGFAKIEDRMAEEAPISLDGMAYMPFASYFDQGRELRLEEDYKAIRWMQENIVGTPVIVEGQVVEYRWGSRYSIYTGLPSVLGWNWHQRQQRTGHDLDVWDRANRIQEFYGTTNMNIANRFISDFDVQYIVVGQMEEAYYAGAGLDKFDLFNGRYWQEVYRDGETRIYEVISQPASEG